ncbi:MAG: elongation factor P [Alphaproteobacteria bacterium]|nr:elongation factor P [Alphaproteobacteria bacterium]
MIIDAISIRAGNIINIKNDLWVVSKQPMHVKPGKGGAFVQVEMKNLNNGNKLNERLRSDERVERVVLDEKSYQFLYTEEDKMHLMDNESYEQIEIKQSLLGDASQFLQDGITVTVYSHDGEPLSAQLPDHVVFAIDETEPVIKGQTAASSYKPAILENGVRVMVPTFISTGDKIVISTVDGSYVERAV